MDIRGFQLEICRLISQRLLDSGEGYVAGGVALNEALAGSRISRDIDLFHDTQEAVETGWAQDCEILKKGGMSIDILRDSPGFKEAVVFSDTLKAIVQWTKDSAFRFFPLVQNNPKFGLTLHPFDLATNKVLALAGRLETRDWIDVIRCHESIQPLGYLAFAACGKDPGFNPFSLLAEAQRSSRYSQEEIDELSFSGPAPDAAELGAQWHGMMKEAKTVCEVLENSEPGTCILGKDESFCKKTPEELSKAVEDQQLVFHSGSIKGSFPTIRPA